MRAASRGLHITFLICLLWPSQLLAQSIYYYESENGELHFSDVPAHDGYNAYQIAHRGEARAEVRSLTHRERTVYSPFYLERLVKQAASRHGVDANLIRAIIRAESNFDPYAVSRAGAQGLMQLMPRTARILGVRDSFDPEQNIDGGVRYLKQLMQKFSGQVDIALAAYNAGPHKVQHYNGIPPYPETERYIKRVLRYYSSLKSVT